MKDPQTKKLRKRVKALEKKVDGIDNVLSNLLLEIHNDKKTSEQHDEDIRKSK